MKLQKKKYHIQLLTSDWKSECCEKSRSQMPLKMLGVCSSRRDQQFWLLNHSISSSYEKDMIKIRKWKSRRILQISDFGVLQVMKNWREERPFEEGR